MLGCGSRRNRVLTVPGHEGPFEELTTLDINADHAPDIVHDLNACPWPLDSNAYDEVHAYEVLEHLGHQGDAVSFFAHFAEIWRVLKTEGLLFATVPSVRSAWLWGDPSHTRVISSETLTFLSQPQYDEQVGKTPMSDFRYLYKADFDVMAQQDNGQHFAFVLRAVKPSRCSKP